MGGDANGTQSDADGTGRMQTVRGVRKWYMAHANDIQRMQTQYAAHADCTQTVMRRMQTYHFLVILHHFCVGLMVVSLLIE